MGIVICLGFAVKGCLDLPGKIAARTVTGVREGVAEVFVDLLHVRPEVREGTKVVWGQTSARTEVIVAAKKIEVGYDWEHRWLGSRKVIRLTIFFVSFTIFCGTRGFAIVGRVLYKTPGRKILPMFTLGALLNKC